MHKASSRLRLFDRNGTFRREVTLPALGTIAGLGGEWDGKEVLFGFQSFTVPPSIYHLDLTSEKTELWDQIKTDIDFSAYEVEQMTYPSADQAKTPITVFLAHRKASPSPPLRGRGVGGEGVGRETPPHPQPLSPEAGARGDFRARRRRCCTLTAASTSVLRRRSILLVFYFWSREA